MLKYVFILSVFFLSSYTPEDHKFYVSRCQVNYNETSQSLEVSMHIFLDDLEEALQRRGHTGLHLCTELEPEGAEQRIREYLQDKFRMWGNGEEVSWVFLGKEPSEDLSAVWCYLEARGVEEVETLRISNEILLEVFDDQKNILELTAGKQKVGFHLLRRGKTEVEAQF